MNTELLEPNKLKRAKIAIYTASIAIPVVVAILFRVDLKFLPDLKMLPPVYATINGITAVVLVAALVAIKQKNKNLHRMLIRIALLLSLIFLVCYVAYHMTTESTVYPETADYRTLYLILLASHIILSIAVVPLVLFTYLFAWQGNYERHKKWTKITWPLWFYVAISGVVVYLMISPYYV